MKVIKEKPEFKPISIILETRKELDMVKEALRQYCLNTKTIAAGDLYNILSDNS